MNSKSDILVSVPKAQRFATSTKTVDFPALDWGINAGETRALPDDANSQEIILSAPFITLTK
jgi:hypothetical protein